MGNEFRAEQRDRPLSACVEKAHGAALRLARHATSSRSPRKLKSLQCRLAESRRLRAL